MSVGSPDRRLLDNQMQHEIPAPYIMFSDHTLPVTDIHCGIGLYSQSRIITSSIDNTCKLWDISSRSLLTTFLFPHPITRVIMDSTERVIFAASPNGDIHQINLFRKHTDELGHHKIDSLGTSERVELDELEKRRLISV
ncbi:uncharacterized protein EI90DRAFT_3291620, partial [Cantharellus anzutake]|uniref:uncharacterized protein n=1 Tax=Cantharellus anzutake TaxID=1750568 RepID=UPI0019082BFE